MSLCVRPNTTKIALGQRELKIVVLKIPSAGTQAFFRSLLVSDQNIVFDTFVFYSISSHNSQNSKLSLWGQFSALKKVSQESTVRTHRSTETEKMFSTESSSSVRYRKNYKDYLVFFCGGVICRLELNSASAHSSVVTVFSWLPEKTFV